MPKYLTETLLYHEMIRNYRSPRKAVEIVRQMLTTGDIKISAHATRAPVIRCFTRSGVF